jgi:hypothetical protein
VAGFCERSDEALGSCTMELVSMLVWSVFCVEFPNLMLV